MPLPITDEALNPNFGVGILKIATCSLWTPESRKQTPFTCPPIGNHTTCILPYSQNKRSVRMHDVTKVQIYYQNRFAIAYGNRYAIWKYGRRATEQLRTQGSARPGSPNRAFNAHSEVGDGLNMPKLQQLTYTIDTNKILKILFTPNSDGYRCDPPPWERGGDIFPYFSTYCLSHSPR